MVVTLSLAVSNGLIQAGAGIILANQYGSWNVGTWEPWLQTVGLTTRGAAQWTLETGCDYGHCFIGPLLALCSHRDTSQPLDTGPGTIHLHSPQKWLSPDLYLYITCSWLKVLGGLDQEHYWSKWSLSVNCTKLSSSETFCSPLLECCCNEDIYPGCLWCAGTACSEQCEASSQ